MRWILSWLLLVVVMCTTPLANAFCGFYVGGAGAQLFNNATMVVLMREGTRTVLSMQNNYQGPPQDFAMVVPVPVVLEEDNVKILEPEVFDRVDKLAAPRLVEYWEEDPCRPPMPTKSVMMAPKMAARKRSSPGLGVKVEAQFAVGEYDVVILSARDSTGLDTWLRQEKYNIPQGAEPVLKPYVEQGMKFFVAKVNTKKVKFDGGQAQLSPLRFHYDSNNFFLPVRLGLLNSKGTQDLIVHILAKGQRYEVANYDNVTIPTNLEVHPGTKKRFGAFYASLFDRTVTKHKNAVVTEYAWASSSCDPCPTPPLSGSDIMTLGGDVMPANQGPYSKPQGFGMRGRPSFGYVLTRLHARYSKQALGEDLVFRAAPPIVGGREHLIADGGLEKGAVPANMNNFQGRYIIRHVWQGKVACKNPRRGIWGGPWSWLKQPKPGPAAAQNLAFVQRGMPLGNFLKPKQTARLVSHVSQGTPLGQPVPAPEPVQQAKQDAEASEASPSDASESAEQAKAQSTPAATPTAAPAPTAAPPPSEPPGSGGCGSCHVGVARVGAQSVGLLLLLVFSAAQRRRKRCRYERAG